jgi:hypothetical protein
MNSPAATRSFHSKYLPVLARGPLGLVLVRCWTDVIAFALLLAAYAAAGSRSKRLDLNRPKSYPPAPFVRLQALVNA